MVVNEDARRRSRATVYAEALVRDAFSAWGSLVTATRTFVPASHSLRVWNATVRRDDQKYAIQWYEPQCIGFRADACSVKARADGVVPITIPFNVLTKTIRQGHNV